MRKIAILMLIVTLTFTFGCKKKDETITAGTKEASEIVIAVQGPETGEIAVYGLQTLYGARQAVKEINAAGGINGKPIKLIHYDSRGDKVEAVNVTQRLINNDKVCAIIGEPTTGALFAMRNVANSKKTIAISAGSTAVGATDGMPYIFRNTLLDDYGAPSTIQFLKESRGWENYALITSINNDYSVSLSETFKRATKLNNVNIVAEQSISDRDTNIAAQVTALKGKKFDAIIFTGYYQEASLILLELRKQGINVPLVGGDGYQSNELYNVAGDASIGTLFFAGFYDDKDNQKTQEFTNKIKATGNEVDVFTAQGYDAMYLLANAAREAKVTNCADANQREAMRDVLAVTKDFDGISGMMSFDEEGSAIKNPFIQEIYKISDGKYGFRVVN